VVIVEEVFFVNLDFHAFLGKTDSELSELTEFFLDLFNNFILLELSIPVHSYVVLGVFVVHLELAHSS